MYCEPELPDFGATSYGWRGFGGLLFEPEGSLIPQYNLEAALKRKIAPVAGMDQGLLFNCQAENLIRHRMPGHYRHDVDSSAVRNRNLIALRPKGDDRMELSVVKEFSNRKNVEIYDVETAGAVPDCQLQCNQEPTTVTSLDEPIAELRASLSDTIRLFARARSQLLTIGHDQEIAKIFQGSVQAWEESQLIPGEIAILATNKMIWTGTIGQNLTRTKSEGEETLRDLIYSNHPRVVLVADQQNVRTIDIRNDMRAASSLLFCSPGFSEELYEHTNYTGPTTLPRPSWTHIRRLPGQPFNLLAVSTYSIFLLDERMPGKAILHNPHCLPHGAHTVTAGAAVADGVSKGEVQSFYLLDQFCTGIWKMELFKHAATEDWSAVRPLHGVVDPNDAKHVVRRRTARMGEHTYPPTRGIDVVVQREGWPGKPAEVLFRYLDDGSVMYRTYHFGLDEKQERRMKTHCLERFDEWSREKGEAAREVAAEQFGEAVAQPKESRCEVVNVEVELPPRRYTLPYPLNPHIKVVSRTKPLKPLQPCHPSAFYSNIVDSYFNRKI